MKSILNFFRRFKAPDEEDRERFEKARLILLAELNQRRIDGAPVTHRRLESLMLASGTNRKEAVRLLRGIGARPSGRHGRDMWTLKQKK